jgi:hypothetical protein
MLADLLPTVLVMKNVNADQYEKGEQKPTKRKQG